MTTRNPKKKDNNPDVTNSLSSQVIKIKPIIKMDHYKTRNFVLFGVIALMVSIGVICYAYLISLKTIQRWTS